MKSLGKFEWEMILETDELQISAGFKPTPARLALENVAIEQGYSALPDPADIKRLIDTGALPANFNRLGMTKRLELLLGLGLIVKLR
jgi:hypothetical protein